MYIKKNINPLQKNVGDCVVRAIATVLNQSWEQTYIELAVKGYQMCDVMSADSVWGSYLHDKGLVQYMLPSKCLNCVTVKQFGKIMPKGHYLLFVGGHVVACIDGDYIDSWDSGDRIVIYYYTYT